MEIIRGGSHNRLLKSKSQHHVYFRVYPIGNSMEVRNVKCKTNGVLYHLNLLEFHVMYIDPLVEVVTVTKPILLPHSAFVCSISCPAVAWLIMYGIEFAARTDPYEL